MRLETFSERLVWLRKTGEVRGRELRNLAGVSLSYSSVVEHKPELSPRASVAQKLAACFGVSPTWLMFGEGKQPDEETVKKAVARARRRASREQAA